jgi:dTDP-4-amino-4,6-dideoxygalactose transaminase
LTEDFSIMQIEMVDLKGQYDKIKPEIDQAVISCIASTSFINGSVVKGFQLSLEHYLGVKHVTSCASGIDSLPETPGFYLIPKLF